MPRESWFDVQNLNSACLVINVHARADTGVLRLAVAGEVDALTGPQLQDAVEDALRDDRPGHLDVDLDGVTFLDSAGITALLLCHANAEHANCRFRLTKAQPGVYRVLQITGLLEHFGMAEPEPALQDHA
jgi:anti-sigma B factor antagonist